MDDRLEPLASEPLVVPIDGSPEWIVFAPDGSRAYVSVELKAPDADDTAEVLVMDTAVNQVVAHISLGERAQRPPGLRIVPDGSRLFVPHWSNEVGAGVVRVVDTEHNTVLETIEVSGQAGGPTGVAITPDGRQLFVATDQELGQDGGKVSIIETVSMSVTSRVRVNPFPSTIGTTPDGTSAWVLDTEGAPAVIDTSTHKPSFPFDGIGGGTITFTPDGRRAYLAEESTLFVHVLDTATHSTETMIGLDGRPTDLAAGRDGNRVYVSKRTGVANIDVIDTATNSLVDPLPRWLGTANGLAITPDGTKLYVSDRQSKTLRVIALHSEH